MRGDGSGGGMGDPWEDRVDMRGDAGDGSSGGLGDPGDRVDGSSGGLGDPLEDRVDGSGGGLGDPPEDRVELRGDGWTACLAAFCRFFFAFKYCPLSRSTCSPINQV